MQEMHESHVRSQKGKWQPAPIFLPGKPHGHGSLVGYSPWRGAKSQKVLSDGVYIRAAAMETNIAPLPNPPLSALRTPLGPRVLLWYSSQRTLVFQDGVRAR